MDNVNNVYYVMHKVKAAMPKLPYMVGNEVVNFALDNFKRQAWLGDTIQPWRPRKNPTKWGTKPKRNGRNILTDTGAGKRSIRVVKADWQSIIVGTPIPYMKAHNEGFRGIINQAVGSFTRKQTYAGVASKFKVKGVGVVTGASFSIKTKKQIKNARVQGEVFVTGFNRKIKQNIPRRRFLGDSPYLRTRIQRVVSAQIMKAFKS